MICPNCKTELIEVNGRYICSDCGREIPENEVMASDWGNGGTVRAGLYGAGTDEPEEGSTPVADFDTSLTETESDETSVAPAVAPETSEAPATSPENPDEPTVEEILQTQSSAEPAETPAAGPAVDTGFYTTDSSQQVSNNNEELTPVIPEEVPVAETEVPTPVIPAQELEPSPGSFVSTQDDNISVPETPTEPEPIVESIPVVETTPVVESAPVGAVAQEIPIMVPPMSSLVASQGPIPESQDSSLQANDTEILKQVQDDIEPTPEAVPEHNEVVKDMFEDTAIATAPLGQDPGIYTDPSYDTNQGVEPQNTPASGGVPMPADKKMNLIVLVAGSVLTLFLIIGGIWAYLALGSKANVAAPVVVDQQTAWQELQVVDGGFKVSFPGTPEKSEVTQAISGTDTALTNYSYTTDDITYSVSFATLDAAKTKSITDNLQTILPALVGEVATPQSLTVGNPKIGKYFTADAIDFVMTSDTASYQGKLMIKGNNYILVTAGSTSGQNVDYSKFIKSFSFISSGSTQ